MKEEAPDLTVVTVCYNIVKSGRANSFRNCLDSIRTQTYGSMEHLIIDGGSADGTLDIIKEYDGQPGFRWISEKDRGIYDAMNKGVRLAKGKYIAFINTDDMFSDNGAVAAMMKAIQSEDADYAFANADVYSANHAEFQHTWCSRIDDIPYGYYPCHQTVFCRTSALREIGGFPEKYMANDNLVMLRLVLKYRPVYLNRVIVNFHVGGASGAMVADKERMKSETVEFFYEEFGKANGLSKVDCELLYEKQIFHMAHDRKFEVGSKLKLDRWVRRFFEIEAAGCQNPGQPATRRVRLKLFGVLPLMAVTVK